MNFSITPYDKGKFNPMMPFDTLACPYCRK